ncbi:hypothetical protein CANCADRAFT_31684 [Tortispora caseinolytica NRRL Y-17796]|uniref:BBC1/AIM3 cysteine proteinase-fold domain-containing protein n=1 Tax=Tortispora caseinolytica NRRL Y-17796 TaxID=767744 RepID=A0A1E4TGK7_9ASCO|nr:hypothetical protein CANCADRAFT_31684 [Tortispora caseinolytica NRRL Y-17796]
MDSLFKGGWHPEREENESGSRLSKVSSGAFSKLRGADPRNSNERDYETFNARPLESLTDPKTFAPPPKHRLYHADAQSQGAPVHNPPGPYTPTASSTPAAPIPAYPQPSQPSYQPAYQPTAAPGFPSPVPVAAPVAAPTYTPTAVPVTHPGPPPPARPNLPARPTPPPPYVPATATQPPAPAPAPAPTPTPSLPRATSVSPYSHQSASPPPPMPGAVPTPPHAAPTSAIPNFAAEIARRSSSSVSAASSGALPAASSAKPKPALPPKPKNLKAPPIPAKPKSLSQFTTAAKSSPATAPPVQAVINHTSPVTVAAQSVSPPTPIAAPAPVQTPTPVTVQAPVKPSWSPPQYDLELGTGWFARQPLSLPSCFNGMPYAISSTQFGNSQTLIISIRNTTDLSIFKLNCTFDLSRPVETVQAQRVDIPPPPELPESELLKASSFFGEHVASWCEQRINQQVGNGECWTLAHDALESVSGCMPSQGLVHGHLIYSWDDGVVTGSTHNIKRGDIIQFRSGCLKSGNRTSYAGAPDHTSVVVRIDEPNLGAVTVLEQNVGGRRTVGYGQYAASEMVSGSLKVFRPMWAQWAGELSTQWP